MFNELIVISIENNNKHFYEEWATKTQFNVEFLLTKKFSCCKRIRKWLSKPLIGSLDDCSKFVGKDLIKTNKQIINIVTE